ncbi:MAG: hypothetical protein N3H31_04375 [Candidatus Nezhaarchaeota archaeon]|nr:hypothetical protein [Candidatus Nezhaarchaeota archaeon]
MKKLRRQAVLISARKVDMRSGWVVIDSSNKIVSYHKSKREADRVASRLRRRGREVEVYRMERGLLAPT